MRDQTNDSSVDRALNDNSKTDRLQARRLRVLLASLPASDNPSQPMFGVPRHVRYLIDALEPDRYDVELACPEKSELWRSVGYLPSVKRQALTPRRRPALQDIASLFKLLRLVGEADVIHCHSSKAGFLVRLAAVLRGRSDSCIYTPHGWSFWAFGGWEGWLYLQLERLAARWCLTIIALSNHERDDALSRGVGTPHKYLVIPNGIDVAQFDVERRPVPGRIIMVARLGAPKRPDLAVQALAALSRVEPDAHLEIVGDGPLRPEIEHLIRKLGVQDRVRLLGQRGDVPALLARASCQLLVSDYEGCPLAVLEGMAAGLPAVVTRFGGASEVVDEGRTGFIVPAEPDAIAAALRKLIADTNRASTMGAAAREDACRRFSSEVMGESVVSVYERIAAICESPAGARSKTRLLHQTSSAGLINEQAD